MVLVRDYFSRQSAPRVALAASGSPDLLLAGKQLAEMGAADVAACTMTAVAARMDDKQSKRLPRTCAARTLSAGRALTK